MKWCLLLKKGESMFIESATISSIEISLDKLIALVNAAQNFHKNVC